MDDRVLRDAAVRRFKAHRILLRARVARRWVEQRRQITGGGPARPEHQTRLRETDATLRTVSLQNSSQTHTVLILIVSYGMSTDVAQDIAAITDQRTFNELKSRDTAAGHWTSEMPDLATTLNMARTM